MFGREKLWHIYYQKLSASKLWQIPVCLLYLFVSRDIVKNWMVKFDESPVIPQDFPPPNIHDMQYYVVIVGYFCNQSVIIKLYAANRILPLATQMGIRCLHKCMLMANEVTLQSALYLSIQHCSEMFKLKKHAECLSFGINC